MRGFDDEPGTELVASFERSSSDAPGEGEVGREGAGDSDVVLVWSGSGRVMTAGVGRFERCETTRSRSVSSVEVFGVSSSILDNVFDKSAQDDWRGDTTLESVTVRARERKSYSPY